MNLPAAGASVAERLYDAVAPLRAERIPAEVRLRCEDLLLEFAGLCVAARDTDYMRALLLSVDSGGACTVVGQRSGFSAEDAAMLNGTAAHGEDFDDTFEGGPVHSGAVIMPAVLAACERFGRDGRAALAGIATGVEVLCRLSLVAPKRIHKAGFHPTAVLGAMASTLAVCVTLGLTRKQTVDALGVAGSMAAGIIEYLAEGAWTKRLHAGWAARTGLHAARIGQSGFLGPRTVFEGTHGLFSGFAHSAEGDFDALLGALGERWHMNGITFKPYATGTMNQPYIDCALRLARQGFSAEDVAEVLCETAEGYVHRLWEPLAAKHRPANEYAAKFSTPFNIAVAFITGGAGLEAFSPVAVAHSRVLDLAAKVRYVVDPDNPYPKAYTGHVRMTLKDGRVFEQRQPHIRGGMHEPLSGEELERKFHGNARHGGWSRAHAEQCIAWARRLFDSGFDLSPLRQ
ncbi:MAG: MmgE/PrpD family protein [Betaproteobacteria bacterium]|nr:MmgE/PrpD family protein [Betaproteobacteria bacterium]